jgi:hypothetical protein
MGEIIRFPVPARPLASTAMLTDQLVAATAELPGLVSAVDRMGRTAESLCNALQGGLTAMNAAFGRALVVNEAHQRLQVAVQQAMELADTDPDAAAGRLAELRADYARLTALR